MKVFILAGGYGKRLRPLTNKIPKPLIMLDDKPIIEWQIQWLKSNNINSFVIGLGYLKHKLISHFKKENHNVEYVVETEPLGTGGAIKNAEDILKNEEKFMVINGDIITNLDCSKLFLSKNDLVSMALVPLKSPYGVIKTRNSRVVEFREKPVLKGYWLNAGIYLMSKKIFNYLPEKGDVEKLFQELALKNRINGVKFTNIYWRSIDSIKDMEEGSLDLKLKKIYTL
ncbi:MAG: nucleotidyltransferase family protein [Candidatus Micrarchaeaceae archaeon]